MPRIVCCYQELNLSTLLVNKKFRARGNKEGALTAMKMLQDDKLGRLIELSSNRGTSDVSL